jgi:hypothetical protein
VVRAVVVDTTVEHKVLMVQGHLDKDIPAHLVITVEAEVQAKPDSFHPWVTTVQGSSKVVQQVRKLLVVVGQVEVVCLCFRGCPVFLFQVTRIIFGVVAAVLGLQVLLPVDMVQGSMVWVVTAGQAVVGVDHRTVIRAAVVEGRRSMPVQAVHKE